MQRGAAFVAADEDGPGMLRFLAQWLDRPGAPVIEAEITRDAGAAQLVLRQVQEGAPYELQIEVDLVADDGRVSTRIVAANGRSTRVELGVGAPWIEARLDPRHRLLIWQPEYGEQP